MEELLQQLADQTGIPFELLERAAAARAAAGGVSAEAIVAGWTGGEMPPPPAIEAPPPAIAVAAGRSSPAVEVLSPLAGPLVANDGESADEGIAEDGERVPVLSGFPGWLAVSFVALPMIAVLYALLTPTAPDCGSAGQLAINPVTGVAENCDGTSYGVDVVNFFAIGENVYDSRCANCHGEDGSGGVGPALTSGAVRMTFPDCVDHVSWVSQGSEAWPKPTYGATAKPVGGSGAVMPAFGEPVLTEEEVAAVVLYERVAFGQEELGDAEIGCGLTSDNGFLAAP